MLPCSARAAAAGLYSEALTDAQVAAIYSAVDAAAMSPADEARTFSSFSLFTRELPPFAACSAALDSQAVSSLHLGRERICDTHLVQHLKPEHSSRSQPNPSKECLPVASKPGLAVRLAQRARTDAAPSFRSSGTCARQNA